MKTLTAQAARDLRPGETLKCHVIRGLELRAREQTKSWHLYYRAPNGEQRRPKIGTFPALPIEAAREAAKAWLRRVAAGEDPSRNRQDLRAAPTVAELGAKFLAYRAPNSGHARAWKVRTWKGYEAIYRNQIVPLLGNLKVAEVTSTDVDRALKQIGRANPTHANRVRDWLSGFFRYCELETVAARPKHSNPVAHAETVYTERARRRHAESDEVPRIFAELAKVASTYPREVAALYVILYAGTRVTELVTARTSQRRGARLVLDEHKTDETGDPRTIQLPRQALEILDGLPVDTSGRIFGPSISRHSVFAVWEKVRAAAGCPDLQVRDFRRTFVSVGRSLGFGLDIMGGLMDHKSRDTTEGYAWLFSEAKESAAQAVADKIDELGKATK